MKKIHLSHKSSPIREEGNEVARRVQLFHAEKEAEKPTSRKLKVRLPEPPETQHKAFRRRKKYTATENIRGIQETRRNLLSLIDEANDIIRVGSGFLGFDHAPNEPYLASFLHRLLGELSGATSLLISARHIAVIVPDDFGKTEN